VIYLYPLRLQASLHETIWGGRRLERDGWKQLPAGETPVGESWETEVSTVVQNGAYAGKTLGEVTNELGTALLGQQATEVFGSRFPLLAKFIDANAQLSVQVHPNDAYANQHEGGKLGKTEFWYILGAEPGASIVYGFQKLTDQAEVEQAIRDVTLDQLLHREPVQAGDVVFVPAGTVHAIGSGVLLYELQEYSDVTYRMYDYGRLTAAGKPRELHIEQSLAVSHYEVPQRVKVQPVTLSEGTGQGYEERCLVASRYFLTREIQLKAGATINGQTGASCIILSCLGEEVRVAYGAHLESQERIARGETMVLPANLGQYRLEGLGAFLFSYVPTPDDQAWKQWREKNQATP
jgi:mannose-6-phosphate isomerase